MENHAAIFAIGGETKQSRTFIVDSNGIRSLNIPTSWMGIKR